MLQVELHNYCNENCVYCNVQCFHDSRHGVLPLEQLVKVLYQVKKSVFEVRLFLNNEATLNVKGAVPLTHALHLAKRICKVRTVIYTNGTGKRSIYLDRNLDHIHLTISAASPETYLKVHGQPYYDLAVGTFKYLMQHRRRSQRVYVHFVEVAENLNELDKWRCLFKDADGLIVSPLHDGFKQEASKKCKRLIDYKQTVKESTLKGSMPSDMPCTLWNNLSVSCFGEILQCCDAPYNFNYGTVNKVSLSKAWQSRLKNKMHNEACLNCHLRRRNNREILEKYVSV